MAYELKRTPIGITPLCQRLRPRRGETRGCHPLPQKQLTCQRHLERTHRMCARILNPDWDVTDCACRSKLFGDECGRTGEGGSVRCARRILQEDVDEIS